MVGYTEDSRDYTKGNQADINFTIDVVDNGNGVELVARNKKEGDLTYAQLAKKKADNEDLTKSQEATLTAYRRVDFINSLKDKGGFTDEQNTELNLYSSKLQTMYTNGNAFIPKMDDIKGGSYVLRDTNAYSKVFLTAESKMAYEKIATNLFDGKYPSRTVDDVLLGKKDILPEELEAVYEKYKKNAN